MQIQTQPETQSLEGHIPCGAGVRQTLSPLFSIILQNVRNKFELIYFVREAHHMQFKPFQDFTVKSPKDKIRSTCYDFRIPLHKHPSSLTCLGSSSPKKVGKYHRNFLIYPNYQSLQRHGKIRHCSIKYVLRSSAIQMTALDSLSDMFQ